MFASRFDCRDRILRHDAAIIFHLDLELIVRHDALTELENFGKPVRSQAMFRILTHVRLN